VKGGYSEELKVGLLEIFPLHQSLVDQPNSHVQSLSPHFELVVEFSQPVDQILSILVWNLALVGLVLEEILWVQVPLFLLPQVFNDLRNKFYNRLRISYFKDVVEIELGFERFQPLFSLCFHLSTHLFHLLNVESFLLATSLLVSLGALNLGDRLRNLELLFWLGWFAFSHFLVYHRWADHLLGLGLLVRRCLLLVSWNHLDARLLGRNHWLGHRCLFYSLLLGLDGDQRFLSITSVGIMLRSLVQRGAIPLSPVAWAHIHLRILWFSMTRGAIGLGWSNCLVVLTWLRLLARASVQSFRCSGSFSLSFSALSWWRISMAGESLPIFSFIWCNFGNRCLIVRIWVLR